MSKIWRLIGSVTFDALSAAVVFAVVVGGVEALVWIVRKTLGSNFDVVGRGFNALIGYGSFILIIGCAFWIYGYQRGRNDEKHNRHSRR